VIEYTFSRCSAAFATQAAMLVDFLGRGRVLSVMAPYHSEVCDHDAPPEGRLTRPPLFS
jgi:hypothetical protein